MAPAPIFPCLLARIARRSGGVAAICHTPPHVRPYESDVPRRFERPGLETETVRYGFDRNFEAFIEEGTYPMLMLSFRKPPIVFARSDCPRDDYGTEVDQLGCHAVARATRESASTQNDLIVQGGNAALVTSALRFAKEHVATVRDADGAVETRFAASAAHAREVEAFGDE